MLRPKYIIHYNWKSTIRVFIVIFTEHSFISSKKAEKVQKEFKELCSVVDACSEMKKFKRKRECLDHFWLNLIKKYLEDADSLSEVVKIVLILSHGNAHVERGFSVNKECIVDNLKEETL